MEKQKAALQKPRPCFTYNVFYLHCLHTLQWMLTSFLFPSCIHDISHCCQVKKKLDEVDLKPVWDVPENPQSEQ